MYNVKLIIINIQDVTLRTNILRVPTKKVSKRTLILIIFLRTFERRKKEEEEEEKVLFTIINHRFLS